MPQNSPFINVRPRVVINGESRAEIDEALLEASANNPQCGSAHSEIRLLNWGGQANQPQADFRFTDLQLGQSLVLFMGNNDDVPVFSGEITAIEERYGDGAPQLVLLAQDRLHRMARERHSRSFEDLSLDDVARTLAEEAGLSCDANIASNTATWHQLNESNLAFLLRLMQPLDILPRLQADELRVRPEQDDSDPFTVRIGDNAVKLRIIADLNHQYMESESRGFDPASGEAVSHRADQLQPPPDGDSAAGHLRRLGWPGNENVPAPFVIRQTQAEAHAAGRYRRRARHFVDGDLICVGEPSLRGGREIDLQNVSPRLQGRYRISHCIHRFSAEDGYKTRLRINRSFTGADN